MENKMKRRKVKRLHQEWKNKPRSSGWYLIKTAAGMTFTHLSVGSFPPPKKDRSRTFKCLGPIDLYELEEFMLNGKIKAEYEWIAE